MGRSDQDNGCGDSKRSLNIDCYLKISFAFDECASYSFIVDNSVFNLHAYSTVLCHPSWILNQKDFVCLFSYVGLIIGK